MVVKFYAPWCRACKAVEPKFLQISKDPAYASIPIAWWQLSVQHNKAYVKSLGIMALPSIQIYAGSEGLVENFPCGPSKVPMLRRKITETINDKVDPDTLSLKTLDCTRPENAESVPCKTRSLAVVAEAASSEIDEVITDRRKEENLRYLRTGVPYFKDFDDDEFYELMDKVRFISSGMASSRRIFFDTLLLFWHVLRSRLEKWHLTDVSYSAPSSSRFFAHRPSLSRSRRETSS